MPFNLTKEYPDLLELLHYNPEQRRQALRSIFNRDIADNPLLTFRGKLIRPTKKEGESSMDVLFDHLTRRDEKDEHGNKTGKRLFEMDRSQRIHWIKPHLGELIRDTIDIFSFEDRINGKNVIRTYIYNKTNEYVLILEPQRSKKDYYLLTAYYLNEKGGKKQISKKLRRKLNAIH